MLGITPDPNFLAVIEMWASCLFRLDANGPGLGWFVDSCRSEVGR